MLGDYLSLIHICTKIIELFQFVNLDSAITEKVTTIITLLPFSYTHLDVYKRQVLDNPTITDQEYDKYLRELLDIETEHPELAKANSPTNRVGDVYKRQI